MNPVQPQIQQTTPQPSQQLNSIVLTKVPSIDVVKQYQVPAGMSVMFMHDTLPYMFIKTAPTSPIESPTITTYKLIEVNGMEEDNNIVNPEAEFVTRKEYQELKDAINSIEERIKSDESIYRGSKKKWSDDNRDRNNPNKSKPNDKSRNELTK